MSNAGTSTADSMIGTTLGGRYRIEARVGSGAMGAVYRAEQTGLGRRVALKIVNRGPQVDYDTVQRFRREATALSALHHPNTVRVFDFGTTPAGLLYLAMELLEGEPLTTRMAREQPLPLAFALSITQQVLRSIGEAHARGLIHRDLKPDNIFLARVPSEPAPIVKVLDFGIAKAVAGAGTINQFETLDGTVFGTPRYMSPEQAGGRTLDARSDLYSVGIMLYELIAGHPPFVDGDAVVVMARHIRDKPMPLSRAVPLRAIPHSLEAVVTRALAKQPTERFQTADEFERALERCKSEITGATVVPFASLRPSRGRLIWPVAAGIALAAGAGALLATNTADSNAMRVASVTSLTPAGLDDTNGQRDHGLVASGLLNALPPAATEELDPSPAGEARSVVSLQTAPPAAAVLQDGSELGVTPLDVSMNKGSTLTLLLKKKGFAAHKLELRAEDGARVVTLRRLGERFGETEKQEKPEKHKERDRAHPLMHHAPGRDGDAPAGILRAVHGTEATAKTTAESTAESHSPTPNADKRSPYERF